MSTFDMSLLAQAQTKPALFERGAPMWDDPYIAQQMLKAHLSENTDAASRKPHIIDQTVQWIRNACHLHAGMDLLDLGCGPGLYCQRFADSGIHTTGIDLSSNSIDYARQHDNKTTYRCQNYLTLDFENAFDVVTLIYGDFCVLADDERDLLLRLIHRALRIDGYLIFDVTTPSHHAYLKAHNSWHLATAGGFWKADAYLVLERGFVYPDDVFVNQHLVIEADGQMTIYRNWFHDYTPASLMPIIDFAGFKLTAYYSDLMGTAYSDESDWCGIIAQVK